MPTMLDKVKAVDKANTKRYTIEQREELLEVALAYARGETTVGQISQALNIKGNSVPSRMAAQILMAIKEGRLRVERVR